MIISNQEKSGSFHEKSFFAAAEHGREEKRDATATIHAQVGRSLLEWPGGEPEPGFVWVRELLLPRWHR